MVLKWACEFGCGIQDISENISLCLIYALSESGISGSPINLARFYRDAFSCCLHKSQQCVQQGSDAQALQKVSGALEIWEKPSPKKSNL